MDKIRYIFMMFQDENNLEVPNCEPKKRILKQQVNNLSFFFIEKSHTEEKN